MGKFSVGDMVQIIDEVIANGELKNKIGEVIDATSYENYTKVKIYKEDIIATIFNRNLNLVHFMKANSALEGDIVDCVMKAYKAGLGSREIAAILLRKTTEVLSVTE